MGTDSFDKVSAIAGEVMKTAWEDFIRKMADAAKGGSPISALKLPGPATTINELKEFFELAGGANMTIEFPCIQPKIKVEHFRAAVIEHGVAPAGKLSTMGISGEISIGIGIRF